MHSFLVEFVVLSLKRVSKSEGVVASLFDKVQNSTISEKHSRLFQEHFIVRLVRALLGRPESLRELPVYLDNVVRRDKCRSS